MRRKQTMEKPILVNVTEEIVHGLVKFLLYSPDYQVFCRCDYCEFKITATVLNKLPTNYVSTSEERNKAFKRLNQPHFIELVNKEIIHVIHLVGEKPGHKK